MNQMFQPFDRRIAPAALSIRLGAALPILRVSVTDRCDFRCVYCMAEDMTFLPKAESADARGTGPGLLGLHRQGRAASSG